MKQFLQTLPILLLFGCDSDMSGVAPISEASTPDTRPLGLPSPHMTMGIGIETGECGLEWNQMEGALWYWLEYDLHPDSICPEAAYQGAKTGFYLGFARDYLFTHYYQESGVASS